VNSTFLALFAAVTIGLAGCYEMMPASLYFGLGRSLRRDRQSTAGD
jgi:hypothetical protein